MEWEDRLAGYHLLVTAGSLVPGLRAETFDAFLVDVRRCIPMGICTVPLAI